MPDRLSEEPQRGRRENGKPDQAGLRKQPYRGRMNDKRRTGRRHLIVDVGPEARAEQRLCQEHGQAIVYRLNVLGRDDVRAVENDEHAHNRFTVLGQGRTPTWSAANPRMNAPAAKTALKISRGAAPAKRATARTKGTAINAARDPVNQMPTSAVAIMATPALPSARNVINAAITNVSIKAKAFGFCDSPATRGSINPPQQIDPEPVQDNEADIERRNRHSACGEGLEQALKPGLLRAPHDQRAGACITQQQKPPEALVDERPVGPAE